MGDTGGVDAFHRCREGRQDRDGFSRIETRAAIEEFGKRAVTQPLENEHGILIVAGRIDERHHVIAGRSGQSLGFDGEPGIVGIRHLEHDRRAVVVAEQESASRAVRRRAQNPVAGDIRHSPRFPVSRPARGCGAGRGDGAR